MATGEPGSSASVVNSGTEQNAVLNFTIPQGATGESGGAVALLSAYSTPSQSGAGGAPLLFDRNGLSYGAAVSHTSGSGSFTLNQPGVYAVAFQGNFAPGRGLSFPAAIGASLVQDGAQVPGAAALHTFHTTADSATLAFSAPVQVTAAPSTLQILGSGSAFLYALLGITVYRLGDIPS